MREWQMRCSAASTASLAGNCEDTASWLALPNPFQKSTIAQAGQFVIDHNALPTYSAIRCDTMRVWCALACALLAVQEPSLKSHGALGLTLMASRWARLCHWVRGSKERVSSPGVCGCGVPSALLASYGWGPASAWLPLLSSSSGVVPISASPSSSCRGTHEYQTPTLHARAHAMLLLLQAE